MPQKISATIITLNEQRDLPECIRSLHGLVDEIVVLDSLSSDATRRVAADLGAQVYEQAYLGDGPQKARAAELARNDWILSIDADERVEDDTRAWLLGAELDSNKSYALRRRNYVGDHWLRAAGFYPDYVIRIYHRSSAAYAQRKSHSRVEGSAEVVRLPVHLRHLTYDSYSHWLERVNALSSRDAWALRERGVRVRAWQPVTHALAALLRKLIMKGGAFQGLDGWTVAMTTAMKAYMKYLKALEQQRADAARES